MVCKRCNDTGWLEPIGPHSDGSYITSRPCSCGLDRRPDNSGLDDGPFLPGFGRKRPSAKSAEENRRIRALAWKTRREKYGQYGHR